jgi:hypothetical protein
VLAGFYAAAEGLLLAVDVAGDVRVLTGQAGPAPAVAPLAAAVGSTAPRDFCQICGAVWVAGNTFCGHCGTRGS